MGTELRGGLRTSANRERKGNPGDLFQVLEAASFLGLWPLAPTVTASNGLQRFPHTAPLRPLLPWARRLL